MTKRMVAVLIAAMFGLVRFSVAGDLPDAGSITPVKIVLTGKYTEGIVFDRDGNGYISHEHTVTIVHPDGTSKVWATGGMPNGHKILGDGTHLICDAERHAVMHLDANGKVLGAAAKECDGKPLRGPNDLSLDPKGGFYFTDPGDSNEKDLTGTVHYVDAQGVTHLVAGGFAYPNGIVLAQGGKRLFLGESKRNRVLVFDVVSPGKVGPFKVFANLPAKAGDQIDNQPDGMCLDANGNLYVAHFGMRQVQVLSPEGKLLARYPAGGNLQTSNVAFGGPNHNQLFVTGGSGGDHGIGGLYRLDLGVKGLKILPASR